MRPNEYDVVALTEDISEGILGSHQDTQESMPLRRGQVGTVMMVFDDGACLIDFADSEGVTYAMETVPGHKLMILFYEPALAVA